MEIEGPCEPSEVFAQSCKISEILISEVSEQSSSTFEQFRGLENF